MIFRQGKVEGVKQKSLSNSELKPGRGEQDDDEGMWLGGAVLLQQRVRQCGTSSSPVSQRQTSSGYRCQDGFGFSLATPNARAFSLLQCSKTKSMSHMASVPHFYPPQNKNSG